MKTNHSDQHQMVFEAQPWKMNNLSFNTLPAATPPLMKTIFIKDRVQSSNQIPLNLGSSPTFTQLPLSIMENANTRGDAQGTNTVYVWTSGPYSGAQSLSLVFQRPGLFTLGFMGFNNKFDS